MPWPSCRVLMSFVEEVGAERLSELRGESSETILSALADHLPSDAHALLSGEAAKMPYLLPLIATAGHAAALMGYSLVGESAAPPELLSAARNQRATIGVELDGVAQSVRVMVTHVENHDPLPVTSDPRAAVIA